MGNLMPIASQLDEMLRGFFVRPMSLDATGQERPVVQFRTDVWETENAYRVLADLPGVRKEDINVTIDGAQVGISAEVKQDWNPGEKDTALLNERFAGRYYRAFTLGHEIDESNAQARYADGVLELTLPKSPNAMPRKIAVH